MPGIEPTAKPTAAWTMQKLNAILGPREMLISRKLLKPSQKHTLAIRYAAPNVHANRISHAQTNKPGQPSLKLKGTRNRTGEKPRMPVPNVQAYAVHDRQGNGIR